MNSIFLKIYLPNLIVCVCLLFLDDLHYMPATVITAGPAGCEIRNLGKAGKITNEQPNGAEHGY